MGAPVNPVDGDKYAELLMGVPMVLEYDSATGGFKLVIDVENSLEVTFTGVSITVGSVEIGSQTYDPQGRLQTVTTVSGTVALSTGDIEIGAVEIKNRNTDDRVIVDGFGQVYVHLPSGTTSLVDGQSPTQFLNRQGSFLMGFNRGDANWDRISMYEWANIAQRRVSGPDSGEPNLGVWGYNLALRLGEDPETGQWRPNFQDEQFRLMTSALVTGTVDVNELRAFDALTGRNEPLSSVSVNDNEFFYGTGSLATVAMLYGQSESAPTYISIRTRNSIGDNQLLGGTGGALETISVPHILDPSDNAHDRMRSVPTNFDGTSGSAIGHQAVAALGFATNENDGWDRLKLDSEDRLHVRALVTGTVDTELAAAIAAADGMANPTVPQVLSNLMGFNGITWDRLYMGISGSLSVDLASRLDAVNDEVTAYITGTTSVELVTGTVVGIGGQTKNIQRLPVNVSGTGGEFELVAAVASQRIKVLSAMFITDQDTNAFFQSGFTGTALTGPMSWPADGDGFFLNFPPTPDEFHFETEPGENLVIDQPVAAAIGGWINFYTEA